MFYFQALKKPLRVPALATIALFFFTACGNITLGQGAQSDPVPSGTIVAQGSFVGVNGRTVSGIAAVYVQANCSFVARLQNLNAPSDSGLQIVPIVNGAPSVSPSFYVLRAPTGNQNYNFSGATCTTNWAQIQIINPALSPQSAQAYGIATLTAP